MLPVAENDEPLVMPEEVGSTPLLSTVMVPMSPARAVKSPLLMAEPDVLASFWSETAMLPMLAPMKALSTTPVELRPFRSTVMSPRLPATSSTPPKSKSALKVEAIIPEPTPRTVRAGRLMPALARKVESTIPAAFVVRSLLRPNSTVMVPMVEVNLP